MPKVSISLKMDSRFNKIQQWLAGSQASLIAKIQPHKDAQTQIISPTKYLVILTLKKIKKKKKKIQRIK
ncbi:hypothetical protein FGO68_gene7528 [Halteria grandinella]|uniref:Uncharacterized protein n=1 Tax=Halteria grandinella TaxID=5974 RepID=A0A8J8NSU1_HALGN|nr:hypothetical protein FGO68_gene7528 [Halteria grandinella]